MATLITTIFNAIISGLTTIPTAVVDAIKSLFQEFVYEDPSAATKTLSDVGYFLLAFLGVSIGMGLVWLVISLFKRKK